MSVGVVELNDKKRHRLSVSPCLYFGVVGIVLQAQGPGPTLVPISAQLELTLPLFR